MAGTGSAGEVLTNERQDQRTDTSMSHVKWSLLGALVTALLAAGAGVGTALIGGRQQEHQAQVDFERSERIATYAAFAEADAAFLEALLRAAGLILDPDLQPDPSGEGVFSDIDPEQVYDMITEMKARQVALAAKGAGVNYVASCEVRNAAKRTLNAAIIAIEDMELIASTLHPAAPGEDAVRDILGPLPPEVDPVRAEFAAAVRSELGIDPPFRQPSSWSRSAIPVNRGLEDCGD
jgi:hypothetical protein